MRDISRRIEKAEEKLNVGQDINRTVLVVSPPKKEDETETDRKERRARIDRLVKEAIQRDPTNPFIFLLA
jgi:hypothetical protein